MKSEYKKFYDGDSIIHDVRGAPGLKCCDCGLIHHYEFDIISKNKIRIAIWRNDKETAKERKCRAKTKKE